jgi:sugar-phosphatase
MAIRVRACCHKPRVSRHRPVDSSIHEDSTVWQAVVTAEDVERRKPALDLFLAAASRPGVSLGQCTVVEDAVNGIAAAKTAGLRCVAVTSTFPAEHLAQADLIRPSISDIRLEDL